MLLSFSFMFIYPPIYFPSNLSYNLLTGSAKPST
uniref:Uncharacterized protein n=1 Tax=Siphoviridae sp. ctlXU33 TaxID=2823598 RepID=A0A8S5LFJ1_9CAUD|nr:MAG TPA: hypothetical protein [Siphoviridae sp. ctlXU33]